jgi:hypothetical protein
MANTRKPKNRIDLEVEGKKAGYIPLTEFIAQKSGNTWLGVAKPGSQSDERPNGEPIHSQYGANVDSKLLKLKGGTEQDPHAGLPTSFTLVIDGTEIDTLDAEPGFTGSDNPKHSAQHVIEVPGMGTKKWSVRISDLGDGRNNLAAAVNGVGGGSATISSWA